MTHHGVFNIEIIKPVWIAKANCTCGRTFVSHDDRMQTTKDRALSHLLNHIDEEHAKEVTTTE